MRDFSSQPRKGHRGRAGIVMLAFGSVALAGSLAAFVKAWSGHRQVVVRLAEEGRELQSGQARLRALETSRNPNHGRSLQAVLTLEAPPPRVFRDLAGVLPQDVRLDSLSLGYGNRVDLDMQVLARTSSAYDAFLGRLEDSGLFENIVPGEENRDGEVRARVQASYRLGVP